MTALSGTPSFGGFVVGIGASTGGLDALERLFSALPANIGAAPVFIRHLSPDRKSAVDNGGANLRHSGSGCKHLQACARAASSDGDARAAYDGLVDVLASRREAFSYPYPCDDAAGRRLWFLMHVAPVRHPSRDLDMAVVSPIDMTAWAAPAQASQQEYPG